MTEHELQVVLADNWIAEPLKHEERTLHLVAREVMPAVWDINDAHGVWQHPSIDFVFIDASGDLWLMELKCSIKGPRDAWNSLCQVLHRQFLFQKYKFTDAIKEEVYIRFLMRMCRYKQDYASIRKNVRNYQEIMSCSFNGNIHCLIAYTASFYDWSVSKALFQEKTYGGICHHIVSRYTLEKSNKEMQRFVAMGLDDDHMLTHPDCILLPSYG